MSSRLVGECLTYQQTKELLWVYDVLCHCLGIVRVGLETQSHISKNYGNCVDRETEATIHFKLYLWMETA